jgi:hypothetical protein
VLTEGFLIPDDDKLVRDLEDATIALASGDGQTAAEKKAAEYQNARKLLVKYVDDLRRLERDGAVQPTVFDWLLAAANALIAQVDAL